MKTTARNKVTTSYVDHLNCQSDQRNIYDSGITDDIHDRLESTVIKKMPIIKIRQCRWCGRVQTMNGDYVDIGLPVFYIEFEGKVSGSVQPLKFDLVTCTDCDY